MLLLGFYILFALYLILSFFSVRWILRQSILNAFQKRFHSAMVVLLPLLWIVLLRMILKPISGYIHQKNKDNATTLDQSNFFDTGGDYGDSVGGNTGD